VTGLSLFKREAREEERQEREDDVWIFAPTKAIKMDVLFFAFLPFLFACFALKRDSLRPG
jgi:hypothetical protein